jgi:hypothetical protein
MHPDDFTLQGTPTAFAGLMGLASDDLDAAKMHASIAAQHLAEHAQYLATGANPADAAEEVRMAYAAWEAALCAVATAEANYEAVEACLNAVATNIAALCDKGAALGLVPPQ